MSDLLVRASSDDGGIAVVAGITTELVRDVQVRHRAAPTATAATGRLVTAAALLGAGLKGSERISLQVAGDGPIGGLSAEAWLLAGDEVGARARARNPDADLPLNANGKFDVAGVVGSGQMQVTKSRDIGQPYVGVVPLHSGEIAEDVAAYLAFSEQIPSVVALGVLASPQGVIAAGGVIATVLPGAGERAMAALEERAAALPPMTRLISGGAGAHDLLRAVAGETPMRSRSDLRVHFACLCTRDKVEVALLGLGTDELRLIARTGKETVASCEFCRKPYAFSAADAAELAARADRR